MRIYKESRGKFALAQERSKVYKRQTECSRHWAKIGLLPSSIQKDMLQLDSWVWFESGVGKLRCMRLKGILKVRKFGQRPELGCSSFRAF